MTETTFAPEQEITRAEYIKMLTGALGMEPDAEAALPFADVPKDHWAYPYVAASYEAGIVQGVSETSFGTDTPISRQDIAVMTQRALEAAGEILEHTEEVKPFADEAEIGQYALQSVQVMQECGILSGTPEGYFYPQQSATRAECAKIVGSLLEKIS